MLCEQASATLLPVKAQTGAVPTYPRCFTHNNLPVVRATSGTLVGVSWHGAAAGTSWPMYQTGDPLPWESTSPCPALSWEGAVTRSAGASALTDHGGAGGHGTVPCVERLCLADSRWVEHLC